MILYLDSSAIVKLFVREPGSVEVRRAVSAAADCFTHLIAYAEVRAAFGKALGLGRETPAGLARHKRELTAMWQQVNVVLPDEPMIQRAGDLAEMFGLRGYDSVHLAAAEIVRTQAGATRECGFAAFDDRLLEAGRALGLVPIAPSSK